MPDIELPKNCHTGRNAAAMRACKFYECLQHQLLLPPYSLVQTPNICIHCLLIKEMLDSFVRSRKCKTGHSTLPEIHSKLPDHTAVNSYSKYLQHGPSRIWHWTILTNAVLIILRAQTHNWRFHFMSTFKAICKNAIIVN